MAEGADTKTKAEAGRRGGGTMKGAIALMAVVAIVFAACGGDTTEPAAFEEVEVAQCVSQPVTVPGITVLGTRIESISDLEVCVDARVKADAVPQVVEFDDCGTPCYAVVLDNFDVEGDSNVEIRFSRDGKAQDPITYDPDPIAYGSDTGRLCVAGVGGPPDPCSARVIMSKSVTATAGKRSASLQWKAAKHSLNEPITGYEVWRSTTSESEGFALVGSTDTTEYADVDLQPKTQYWYYVVAVAEDGNRAASDPVEVEIKK